MWEAVLVSVVVLVAAVLCGRSLYRTFAGPKPSCPCGPDACRGCSDEPARRQ